MPKENNLDYITKLFMQNMTFLNTKGILFVNLTINKPLLV